VTIYLIAIYLYLIVSLLATLAVVCACLVGARAREWMVLDDDNAVSPLPLQTAMDAKSLR